MPMPRRPAKRKRGRRRPALPRLSAPQLEPHQLDLLGLGVLALGAYLACVLYFGVGGGTVGGALEDALLFLFGKVAYVVPPALVAGGVAIVARPLIPAPRPLRAGLACLALALLLGFGAGAFGLGGSRPAHQPFMHAAYVRHHGGVAGDGLYYLAKTLFSDFGARIIFVLLVAAAALLLTGTSVATLVVASRRGLGASVDRVRRRARTRGERRPRPLPGQLFEPTGEPPEVEPLVRATHVEAPARDTDEHDAFDVAQDERDRSALVPDEPESELRNESFDPPEPPAEHPEPEQQDLTPQGRLRSSVTEADDFTYTLPNPSFLRRSKGAAHVDTRAQERTAAQLTEALGHFGVDARLVGTVAGPHVTRYELRLAPGTKMSKVSQLKDDLAYALAATDVRILAPIPGKQAVGVEVPNADRRMVHLGDVFQEAPQGWSPLTVWLGKDIAGKAIGTDLAKQPHILVAGTTGSGKSGCVNAMLSSILLRASPHEVKLVLVDPKQVELNHYESIPHLITPVVTSPRLAANVLANLIKEMEGRYAIMSRARTRNLVELNRQRVRDGERALPYILCVIDELADLMMVAPGEVEDSIIRLAQKSRAVGIHLVLATQRPSADIITGMIKANVPARIAFAVSSQTDSRVILDQNGAESLLGQGDMLFRPASEGRAARIQGAFITEEEIERLTTHWRRQGEPELQEELLEAVEPGQEEASDFDPDADDLLVDAISTVVQLGSASTSMLQRRLRVGYTRAGRLIDMMERRGVISGYEGSKARQVLITEADLPRVLAALEEPVGSAAREAGE
jgi:DNA segregation ATPase FtsK/SpoIIIE, S-DNA-T family